MLQLHVTIPSSDSVCVVCVCVYVCVAIVCVWVLSIASGNSIAKGVHLVAAMYTKRAAHSMECSREQILWIF